MSETTQDSQVNMLTLIIQQVTAQSKAKKDLWVEHDEVRKQAQEWVEEGNAKQATEILVEHEAPTVDLTELACCQITMTLENSYG